LAAPLVRVMHVSCAEAAACLVWPISLPFLPIDSSNLIISRPKRSV
jgi:hypothetical protein